MKVTPNLDRDLPECKRGGGSIERKTRACYGSTIPTRPHITATQKEPPFFSSDAKAGRYEDQDAQQIDTTCSKTTVDVESLPSRNTSHSTCSNGQLFEAGSYVEATEIDCEDDSSTLNNNELRAGHPSPSKNVPSREYINNIASGRGIQLNGNFGSRKIDAPYFSHSVWRGNHASGEGPQINGDVLDTSAFCSIFLK